jgi:5-formyltetrahydrofolate cyclo-ligase
MDIKQKKIALRKLITERRDRLADADLAALSRDVARNLFAFEPFQRARTVMFFVAFRSEVHTLPMIDRAIDAGKVVVVPVSLLDEKRLLPCRIENTEQDLAAGSYGILEPPPERRVPVLPELIDFVCLPGLGFDRRGNRLGYGGGYYDRFLESLRPDTTLAALAFSFQIVESVPAAAHDKPVPFVITDKEIIDCGL